MVGDHAERHICIVDLSIFLACKSADMIAERFDRIHIKDRIHILYNRSQTLQSHSCINVLLFQFTVMSVAVIVKLGEYVVPDLHITVALASHGTVRTSASVFLASVIINLRTRSARSGTMLPEVVLFSKTEDPLCRDSHLLIPDLERFLIFFIDRRIQSVCIQTYNFGQKFP